MAATLVKFYTEKDNSILAVFPQLHYNRRLYGKDQLTCYAHIGQHSGCHKEYLKDLKPATDLTQCIGLVNELTKIGYNLKILNTFS